MLVYQFGTFDVANYGDLLFPLLARKRLACLDAEIIAVSPVGGPPIWSDCMPSIRADKIENIAPPAGVLIGGGYTIRLSPSRIPTYNVGTVQLLGNPDIWIGASLLAETGVPVCWNAPGVPAAFASEQYPFVRDCISRSSYVSVRDEQSRAFLLEASPSAEISVCPDPAWDLPRLWTASQLEEAYEEMFSNRGEKRPTRSISVHLNSRFMAPSANQIVAGCLDNISRKFDARVVLLATGPCHGDDTLTRLIGGLMTTKPLIVDLPASLKEVVSCIVHSEAYLGSSMHGLITAASFGVPGICVTSGDIPKFQGLRDQFGDEEIWSRSWEMVPEQLLSLNMGQKRKQLGELQQRMQERLDRHWGQIINVLEKPLRSFDNHVNKNDSFSTADKRFISYRANFAAIEATRYMRLLDKAKSDIARRDTQIASKNSEIERLKRYHEELYRVYVSRSWRYTAPVRKIGTLICKALNLLHKPRLRVLIKDAYFMLPAFIRKSRFIENLKYRFKSREGMS